MPAVMAVAAVLLALAARFLDSALGMDWVAGIGWLYANEPEGARAVLSTIAGSMITVAGVTFSMTIVSVSFATGQIGPRLVHNFMRDRANQVTLGTFIATFLYCLIVLRSVRGGAGDADAAFVPHIAILLALLLAMASVAVLIFFIHHVPESINVSNLLAGLGRDLDAMIDSLFPDRLGTAPEDPVPAKAVVLASDFLERAKPVTSAESGYIRVLDEESLLRAAVEHDLIVRLQYRPGDFAVEGDALLLAWPVDRVDEAVEATCRRAFVFSVERTKHQNLLFLVDELVEIIARALSPGVNDPFTAITAMDWLRSSLARLATRQSPQAFRTDGSGRLRIVAHPVTFARVASAVFDQTRPYVSADRNAALHMMKMIAEIAAALPAGSDRDLMVGYARTLLAAAEKVLPLEIDRRAMAERYEMLLRVLDDESLALRLRDDQGWFGGTA